MFVDLVLKFGGAALADGPSVRRACELVAARADRRPVVVVSAHRGVTDLLATVAEGAAMGSLEADRVRIRHRTLLKQLDLDPELCDRLFSELYHVLAQVRQSGRLSAQHLDFTLSFGERLSARIVAQTLRGMGVLATPVDAYDLGFTTDSNHGRARPLEGIAGAIRSAVSGVPGIAVVTGFLAKDRSGNLTTLGRNGSDLTAALIAEAVGARELQFWKAVDGIMTADPQHVPEARSLDHLSFEEAAEFAYHGARILHPASIEPAVRAQVAVRVCNALDPDSPGTVLEPRVRRTGPAGMAARAEVLALEYELGPPERRGADFARFFECLHEADVTPGPVVANGDRLLAYVEPGRGVALAAGALGQAARVTRGLASLAIIGTGVGRHRILGRAALECLIENGIRVEHAFLGERELSQSFIVPAKSLSRALGALHGELLPEGESVRAG